MDEITYEILGYGSLAGFDDGEFLLINDGIIDKDTALTWGALHLALNDGTAVVKVQSSDREFIEIFRKGV